jgi:hypothetical protein
MSEAEVEKREQPRREQGSRRRHDYPMSEPALVTAADDVAEAGPDLVVSSMRQFYSPRRGSPRKR